MWPKFGNFLILWFLCHSNVILVSTDLIKRNALHEIIVWLLWYYYILLVKICTPNCLSHNRKKDRINFAKMKTTAHYAIVNWKTLLMLFRCFVTFSFIICPAVLINSFFSWCATFLFVSWWWLVYVFICSSKFLSPWLYRLITVQWLHNMALSTVSEIVR